MIKTPFVFPLLFFFFGFLLAGPIYGQGPLVINEDLQLLPLTENLYLHLSWAELAEYGRFSSNGVLYIRDGEALMVDTPMEEELTKTLVQFIQDSLRAKVTLAIPGHFHDDCLAGLPYLHSIGARSISGKKTRSICKQEGLVLPQKSFRRQKTLLFQDSEIVLGYFGGGHSPDNIVVWFPEEKVLFGGCLIRSLEAKGLGNVANARLDKWGSTVTKIQRAFPEIKTVIPGHGPLGDQSLLQHTISLVEKNW